MQHGIDPCLVGLVCASASPTASLRYRIPKSCPHSHPFTRKSQIPTPGPLMRLDPISAGLATTRAAHLVRTRPAGPAGITSIKCPLRRPFLPFSSPSPLTSRRAYSFQLRDDGGVIYDRPANNERPTMPPDAPGAIQTADGQTERELSL